MAKTLPFELTRDEYIVEEFEKSNVPYLLILVLSSASTIFFYSAFINLYGASGGWANSLFRLPISTGSEVAPIFAFLAALSALFGLVAAYIYSLNRMFLTNEHVVRIKQHGLVATDKKVINHLNIEDVKARQNIVGRLFGYGRLTMSTEGQNATYEIAFIKRPFEFARLATDTRDEYEKQIIKDGGKNIPVISER